MWRAGKAWLPVLLAGFGADKTTSQSWQHVYDIDSLPEVIASVGIVPDDTSYRIFSYGFGATGQRTRFAGIMADGDTSFTRRYSIGSDYLTSGASGSMREDVNGDLLFCGTLSYTNGAEPDGLIWKFSAAGDSLWVQVVGDTAAEHFNSTAPGAGGGYVLTGVRRVTQTNVWVVAVDTDGNVIWQNEYGGTSTGESANSIAACPDGGYIIGGYKVLTGSNWDMYALKIDASGNEQWAYSYGSPWIDNVGYLTPLPDGRLVMAGAERVSVTSNKRPALYLLNANGGVIWEHVYDDDPTRSVFFALPVVMEDGGFAAAGDQNVGAQTIGMLQRTDSSGNMLWRRTYKTNDVYDHYIYDLRRTLDGGFIMAGTAFDSMLVSQDAWLIKVDSFGCLVPGCQGVGVQEYVTGLNASLVVSPNPARDRFSFELRIPETISLAGPVRASLLDATGRLVLQNTVKAIGNMVSDSFTFPPDRSAGILYLHLHDDRQWLAGAKVVVE